MFGITRMVDLWVTGAMPLAFEPTYEAGMFWAEFLLFVPIPFIILATPRRRAHLGTLYAGGLCVVAGFILNRLNVCITGFEAAQGGSYLPSFGEVAIGLMVVAGVFAVYRLAVQYLPVYPEVRIPETGFRVLKSSPRERTASSRPQAVG